MRTRRPSLHGRRSRPVHPGLEAARRRDREVPNETGTENAAGNAPSGLSDIFKTGLNELGQAVRTAMTNESGIAESSGRMTAETGTKGPLEAEFGIRVQFGLDTGKDKGGNGGGGGRDDDRGPRNPEGPKPTHGKSLEDKRFEMVDMGDFLKVSPLDGLDQQTEAVFVHQKEDNRLLIQDKDSGEIIDTLDLPCSIDLSESGPSTNEGEEAVLLKKRR